MANTPTTDEPPAVLGYADGKPPRSRRTDRVTITIMFVVTLVLVGTIVAVSLPDNQATIREPVNRAACAENLRQIGRQCVLTAGQRFTANGAYPDSLGDVWFSGLASRAFVCPSSTAVPASTGGTVGEGMRRIQNSPPPGSPGCCVSYVYIGRGLSTLESPDSAVVAYEPPVNHGNEGGHVLFADFSVAWYDTPQLNAIIAAVQAGQNPPPPATTQPTKP